MSETLTCWLERHGGVPRLERELLLCHHLGLDRAALIAAPERPVDPLRLHRLDADAERLAAGEPLAYVTGERGFWTFTLEVTPDVLIPRPETETLVEAALQRLSPDTDRILDLGTGSGAIAIALALETGAAVTATDASAAALAVARRNAERLRAAVDFVRSDWFDAVEERFGLIVANPPYVAAGDAHLADLVHEPQEALIGGRDGLDALRRIIGDAPDHLDDDGWLLVEHGYDQAESVRTLFETSGFTDIELVRDAGGQPRVTLGRRRTTRGSQ